MSAPPRGPRGGREPRTRGGGRGGANASRTRVSDGNDSDGGSAARRNVPRGRGRGTNSQNTSRGITQAIQEANRSQYTSRGSRTSRGGSRAATPATGGNPAGFEIKSSNETPDQRFQRLKSQREVERAHAQSMGLISGDKAVDLKNAITIVGTCQEMCAEFERARRILQKDVAGPERVSIYKDSGEVERVVDESKMVKKFQRSAAGIDEQLPSDLRPPAILLKTADYLFKDILSDEDSLQKANMFIWDRTRAIRNDFSIQQVKKLADVRIAIECYEKIARYHILSLHQIGGRGQEYAGADYNWQQDREQLDKTLLSLLTYYEHVKQRYRSPNEVEFRSYWILFQIGNVTASVEEKVQTWPVDTLKHPRIRRALDIYAAASDVISVRGPLRPFAYLAIAQQNWQKFWTLVGSKQTSYLMSCVAEIGFNIVRRVVLNVISITYNPGGKKEIQDWTLEKMTEVLGFDDEDTTREFIEQSNLMLGETQGGTQYLKLTVRHLDGLPDPSAELPKQVHSWHLVERKRFGRSWPAVIAGMSFKVAKENGMLVPDWNEEAMAQSGPEDGLFVNGLDEHEPTTAKTPAQFNPFASNFTPTGLEKKLEGSNPFGQPSAFGQPSMSPGLTAESSNLVTPLPAVQPMAPAAQTSTSTFGPLPKFFSFSSAQSPGTSAPPQKSFNPPTASPFPTAATAEAPSNPFSAFPSKSETENLDTPSHPFATQSISKSVASTSPASNGWTAFTTPKAPSVPSVQVTPPEPRNTATNMAFPKKVTFDLPPASSNSGFSFSTKPAPTPSTASFTFAGNTTAAPAISTTEVLGDKASRSTLEDNTSESTLSGASQLTGKPIFPTFKPVAEATAPIQKPTESQNFSQSSLPSFSTMKLSSNSTAVSTAISNTPPGSSIEAPMAKKAQVSAQASVQAPTAMLKSISTVSPSSASEGQIWEQTRKENAMDYLTEQLVCDPDPYRGYFKQYVGNIAGPLIKQIMEEEELRRDLTLASSWRRKRLMTRFGLLWKRNAAMVKSRRKRFEMKQRSAEARLKRASTARALGDGMGNSKTNLSDELAQFRAEEERKQKQREEASAREQEGVWLSLQEGQQQYAARTSATNSFDLIGQRHIEPMPPPARPKQPGAIYGHRRSKTQPDVLAPHNGAHRVSKPSKETSPALSMTSSRSSLTRASLINGGSLNETGLALGKKASSMQSPYFRLKAAGFGPTWKTSLSSSITGIKRPRLSGDDILANGSIYDDNASLAPVAKRLRSPADEASLSSPVRAPPGGGLAMSFGSSTSSNGAYKRSAEDEELLARVRRLRDALDEGENWFKDEVNKDELRRSQLDSRPQSQAGSPTGPNGEDLSKLPKFYSRVSRFVPWEEYGIRKEKREIKEELKGKEKAHGNKLTNGTGGRGRQVPSPAPPKPTPSKAGTSWDDAIEL